jgi:hypothetical protein
MKRKSSVGLLQVFNQLLIIIGEFVPLFTFNVVSAKSDSFLLKQPPRLPSGRLPGAPESPETEPDPARRGANLVK